MSVQLVAAPLGSMDATGSGYVETQQLTSASHSGLTHVFKIDLPISDDLFTAFSWADVNTEGNTDASAGDTNFTVSLDQAKFSAALQSVIENAIGGRLPAGAPNTTIASSSMYSASVLETPGNMNGATAYAQTVFDREVRVEIEGELDTNGVLEYLEGDSLGNFNLALDASAGAADMTSKLVADSNAALRHLFLQIPNRDTVVALTDSSGSFLPLATGDAIGFVFNVSTSVAISEVPKEDAAAATAGAANSTAPALDVATVSYGSVSRKVAFVVTVSA